MKVHFFATLRSITGSRVVEFDVARDLTAQELLGAIVRRFPAMKKELLDADGRMYGHVHFFINGRDVQFMDEAFQTRITPEDTVNVFPAVGGG